MERSARLFSIQVHGNQKGLNILYFLDQGDQSRGFVSCKSILTIYQGFMSKKLYIHVHVYTHIQVPGLYY